MNALSAEEMKLEIERIANLLMTQDNLCTAIPIFTVQQRRRLYGMDTDYADDNIVWITSDDCYEADPEEVVELNEHWDEHYKEPENWTRTAYLDQWEFVTACLTREACDDYIRLNRHNLKDPRVYVESGYRNNEWEFIREYLKSFATVAPREA